jgi:hypothetical protein
MPILKSAENVKRFYLPTTQNLPDDTEKAWVDLEVGSFTAGDVIGVDPDADRITAAVKMLTNRIKDWNFTNEAGEKAPITFESVKLLDIADFTFLAEQIPKDIEGLTVPEKKS